MAPDPSLTPELIQARAFTAGFRGYDQSEVRDFLNRIAAEVRSLREHADNLESAWRSAEERATRPPVLDEETLMAAVGEETAAILRTARASAAELRNKAAEDALRIKADSETALAEEVKKGQEAAAGIVESAREEGDRIISAARAEADAIRANAEQDRAMTIDGANSTREKILEDLTRRRRVATVQIEQLRAGRERLLESYAVVRRTLEEAHEDLTRADAEARAAADEVGRRMRDEHPAPVDHPPAAHEPATQEPAPHEPAPQEPAQQSSTESSPVDELFAKIRGDQPEPPVEPVQPVVQEVSSSGDESWLQKREAVVANLEVSLTRKLKRALQDEQNDLLDRLRGLRGEVTAAALLPDAAAHTARYSKAAAPLVEQAATAGAAFAKEALGSGAKTSTRAGQVDDLARDAAEAIVSALRRRLEAVISAGAGEDQSVLVESLGGAYREWKSQRIERVAGDALAAAFSRGTWHAVPDGTGLRWVVEDADGPCPDCDDDALAGAMPKGGEPFPTGQPYPPAHSGCRCLLVPVPG